VSCKSQQVNIHCRDINRERPRRLGGIDTEDKAVLSGDSANIGHGNDRPRDIGGVGQKDGLRVLLDGRYDNARIEFSRSGTGKNRQLDTACLHSPQGPHDGVVLHGRGDHMVAGFQKAKDGNVYGLRGILRQNDPQRVVNAQESGYSLTSVEDGTRPASMDILCPERPGLPPVSRRHESTARIVVSGFGHDVAALSK
jgi:hypothetical protein